MCPCNQPGQTEKQKTQVGDCEIQCFTGNLVSAPTFQFIPGLRLPKDGNTVETVTLCRTASVNTTGTQLLPMVTWESLCWVAHGSAIGWFCWTNDFVNIWPINIV